MTTTIATEISDPINRQILEISEDRIQGFLRNPFAHIATLTGLPTATILERIRAMLAAGTIRRVRQTLMATNLAPGALVAWKIDPARLSAAFDFMFTQDPFSGHVVIRSTDAQTPGSAFRLWTTLKIPQGFSMQKHAQFLAAKTGAESFLLMPAKRLFTLGVGHMRRKKIEPGDKTDSPGEGHDTHIVELTELQWRVLIALKREFTPDELTENLWAPRALEAGVDLETFCQTAEALNAKKVIGRFSTFLEHVKPLATGERVTKFNALFHWAVPPGEEMRAGQEVARFHCMTHAYWREGGPQFANVNVMGVAHGTQKDRVLAHKAAIDAHLAQIGIPISYTSVFWGGRSEIKPSEISPFAYKDWCKTNGLDPATMRA